MKAAVALLALLLFTGSELITINNPWARPAGKGTNSALYVTIENTSDMPDTLYKAESDIAEVVEVHETYEKGDDMMGMRHVEFIEVPAKGKLMLKPMSYHIMLIKLNEDLPLDKEVNVKLFFKHAGEVDLTAVVKDNMQMKHHKKADCCEH